MFVISLLLSFNYFVYAEGGNGDGTGGGKNQPLTLVSSSVANGDENVSVNPEFVLTFSKNVVNFTVRENNEKCFSMTDGKGNDVPVNVIMGDDQIDPSIKRIITVTPKSSLNPGESYLLKIGGDITSKSGVKLGKDIYIGFTVSSESKESQVQAVTETVLETAENTAETTNTTELISDTTVAETDVVTSGETVTASSVYSVTSEYGLNVNDYSELDSSEYSTETTLMFTESYETVEETESQLIPVEDNTDVSQSKVRFSVLIIPAILIIVSAITATIIICNKKKSK